MNLLLDTHALLWWLQSSDRLGPLAIAALAEPRNTAWVSAVTAWEIAIKTGLGRLDMDEPPELCLPRAIAESGFRELPVTLSHALSVRTLPPHHGDPFDRLLIAQALAEDMHVVTVDSAFAAYPVPILRADR